MLRLCSPLVTDQRRDAANDTRRVGPPGHGPDWSRIRSHRLPV